MGNNQRTAVAPLLGVLGSAPGAVGDVLDHRPEPALWRGEGVDGHRSILSTTRAFGEPDQVLEVLASALK